MKMIAIVYMGKPGEFVPSAENITLFLVLIFGNI